MNINIKLRDELIKLLNYSFFEPVAQQIKIISEPPPLEQESIISPVINIKKIVTPQKIIIPPKNPIIRKPAETNLENNLKSLIEEKNSKGLIDDKFDRNLKGLIEEKNEKTLKMHLMRKTKKISKAYQMIKLKIY